MAHPGHLGATGAVEAGLLREDRQDAVGEADQAGGATVADAERPLLRGDVVGDRHPGQAAADAAAQAHVGAHVVDQHHPIGGGGRQPAVHAPLQPQGGQNQWDRLPQADRPHRRRVGQQAGAGPLHARAPQGGDLQRQPALIGFGPQGLHQQAPLQITGHLAGADQQALHPRPAGRGPRRPGPIEASRKLTRVSAGACSVCWRATFRASASTASPR